MNREEAIKILRETHDKSKFSVRIALETLAPELRESEDERISKAIIDALYSHTNSINVLSSKGYSMDDVIAYLEKQKASSELGKYIAAERTKPGFMFAGNDSVSWEELPLDVRKHDYPYYFIGDLDCYPFDVEEQKEQKDYRKLYEDIAKSEWFKKAYVGKSLGEEDTQKEQKPEEWSEIDRLTLDSIVSIVEDWENEQSKEEKEYYGATQKSDWLKAIPERFNPQPKQEWSEEDEIKFEHILAIINVQSQEPEENKKLLTDFIKLLRPSWKPSGAQMEALHTVCYVPELEMYGGLTDWLKELYEQLKALM